jgi:AAA domain
MFYGDGGAGKTTLCIDLACHLAAGDDWLGFTVAEPVRVLLVENEGPRPQFRAKLRRKRDGWQGSPLGDRVRVLEDPWASITLPDTCDALALLVDEHDVDVLVIGPVTRTGMNEAGTLQEVRDFMGLVAELRERSGRPLAVVLVHHENKGGSVSGAWEGAGDTLLHVQGQGHGRTRLYVQKARWASVHHATTLQLRWTDGDGFELEERDEITEESMADAILDAAREQPGSSWRRIREHPSVKGNVTELAEVRDRLLRDGLLINRPAKTGQFALWAADDPATPTLPGSEPRTAPEPPEGGTPEREPTPERFPVPTVKGNRDTEPEPATGVEPAQNNDVDLDWQPSEKPA